MRKQERAFRLLLKQGVDIEAARSRRVNSQYQGYKYFSHWSEKETVFQEFHGGRDWHPFCGCNKIEYVSPIHFHFTEVDCSKARVAFCVNSETGEISKHPILACPHSEYREVPNE